MHPFVASFIGGVLIGLASLVLLGFNGKILGVSGIIGGLLKPASADKGWRLAFLMGLLVGGFYFLFNYAHVFQNTVPRSYLLTVVAGILVGWGTAQAKGCTSGHGVCGISRFSFRSILATMTFIFFGALTVFILRQMGGDI